MGTVYPADNIEPKDTTLEEQIQIVARTRRMSKELNEAKNLAYQKWEQDNASLLESLNSIRESCTEAESLLRELTLKVYHETGDKRPAEGVAIREITKLDYDPKQAFDWALHHEMALKLDVSAFEKIAKTSPPGFVTIRTDPQATIASELKEE